MKQSRACISIGLVLVSVHALSRWMSPREAPSRYLDRQPTCPPCQGQDEVLERQERGRGRSPVTCGGHPGIFHCAMSIRKSVLPKSQSSSGVRSQKSHKPSEMETMNLNLMDRAEQSKWEPHPEHEHPPLPRGSRGANVGKPSARTCPGPLTTNSPKQGTRGADGTKVSSWTPNISSGTRSEAPSS